MDSVEHFSIPVDDIERARGFSAAVFGFEHDGEVNALDLFAGNAA